MSAQPIEAQAMQRLYHNGQEYAQSQMAKTGVEPRMQGTKANKSKILSFGWVLDIMRFV